MNSSAIHLIFNSNDHFEKASHPWRAAPISRLPAFLRVEDSKSCPPKDGSRAVTQLPESEAISKPYLVRFPDDSRQHINRELRDEMLLCGSIKQTGPCRYLYIGQVYKFRSFADLQKISVLVTGDLRRFLNGFFIWVEPDGDQIPERLETPEGMTERLNNPRGKCCRWKPTLKDPDGDRTQGGHEHDASYA